MTVSTKLSDQSLVYSILRVGVAMEFLGHGMLGLRHPVAWTAYFGVMGIHPELANRLMPVVGSLDITLAALVLLLPCRALLGYMMFWGFFTAVLRPLAGESIWEAVERAGNYGAPLALLLIMEGGRWKNWFASKLAGPLEDRPAQTLETVLRWTTILLLLGHGALGFLVHKPLFAIQYNCLGFPGAAMEPWVGGFEMLLGLTLIGLRARSFLYFVVLWKLATEALSPIAGTPIWVFIEHGGSYAAPLALIVWQASELKPARLSQTA